MLKNANRVMFTLIIIVLFLNIKNENYLITISISSVLLLIRVAWFIDEIEDKRWFK